MTASGCYAVVMAYDYDKLYRETPHALGAANAHIAAFFETIDTPVRVLDIGCGQGRDALPIARRGHRVVGVDISPAGIDDLIAAAAADGLDVTGCVADIRQYRPEGRFDILLIDRTLHMLDKEARVAVLNGLLGHVSPGGWLLLLDEPSNMADFLNTLEAHSADWRVERHERGMLFAMRPA